MRNEGVVNVAVFFKESEFLVQRNVGHKEDCRFKDGSYLTIFAN